MGQDKGFFAHQLGFGKVSLTTRFSSDYLSPTQGSGTEHVDPKPDNPHYGRKERLFRHFEGSLKEGSVGTRKFISAGNVPTVDYDRKISVLEG